MALDYVLVSIIISLLPLGAMIYLLVILRLKDTAGISALTQRLLHYEQNKTIKYLLSFIIIAFALKFVAFVMYIANMQFFHTIEVLQISSDIVLTAFIIYLISSKKFLGSIETHTKGMN